MEKFAQLKSIVEGLEADVNKFEAGNAAAGTRVRKGLQEVKKLAQEVRLEIQAAKNAKK